MLGKCPCCRKSFSANFGILYAYIIFLFPLVFILENVLKKKSTARQLGWPALSQPGPRSRHRLPPPMLHRDSPESERATPPAAPFPKESRSSWPFKRPRPRALSSSPLAPPRLARISRRRRGSAATAAAPRHAAACCCCTARRPRRRTPCPRIAAAAPRRPASPRSLEPSRRPASLPPELTADASSIHRRPA